MPKRITWRIALGLGLLYFGITGIPGNYLTPFIAWVNAGCIIGGTVLILWQIFISDRNEDTTWYWRPGTMRCKVCGKWYPKVIYQTHEGIRVRYETEADICPQDEAVKGLGS